RHQMAVDVAEGVPRGARRRDRGAAQGDRGEDHRHGDHSVLTPGGARPRRIGGSDRGDQCRHARARGATRGSRDFSVAGGLHIALLPRGGARAGRHSFFRQGSPHGRDGALLRAHTRRRPSRLKSLSVLRRNILANFGGQAATTIIAFVTVPLYVRYLGTEGYGLVSFMLTLQALTSILDFGLSTTANREVSRYLAQNRGASERSSLVRTLEVFY